VKKILLLLLWGMVISSWATVKIMPLGDSITYDNNWEDLDNPRPESMRSAYRNYLWYKLRDIGYSADFVGSRNAGSAIVPSFDPDNEGWPGWTSNEIAEKTYEWVKSANPDIILLHAGSNDWDESPAGVEEILSEIDRYETESGKSIKVILALIIDRANHADYIPSFNNNIKTVAQKRMDLGDNLTIVDMYSGAGIDYSTDMSDNTHPNDVGYEKMANVWYKAITGKSAPSKMYSQIEEELIVVPETETTSPDSAIPDTTTPATTVPAQTDSLYEYPYTLVDEAYVIDVEVDEEARVVSFTTTIPDTGIQF